MGKIRVKTLGIEEEEKKNQAQAKKRAEQKKAEKKKEASEEVIGSKSRHSGDEQSEDSRIKQSQQKNDEIAASQASPDDKSVKEEKKAPAKKKSSYAEKKTGSRKKTHSEKYAAAVALVDKNKTYSLSEALTLLPKLKVAKFDETVELHINTTETGLSGMMTLPHGTGKQINVVIADDKVIEEISAGKINFDMLLATPQMMPKLAKVAKVLGPKGLMPNPKNGTITANPEETAKKFQGGQMRWKTEAKNPIIHLTVGKVSFGDKKLAENISFALKTINPEKMKKVVLKSTMSPAIKIDFSK